ncbi:MAG TPA: hypothetical protein VMG10_10165 [Gemmataceae bacterium]|nr:hypothetical protein [Gemmataceae bacterium]
MRPLRAFFLFALSFHCTGCALFTDTSRNIGVGLLRSHEAKREWRRDYRWAERAWAENCAAAGANARSQAYAIGFKDGFAEYLFRGGNGEPPLVAPLRFRRLCKQTPRGYQAIDDWFMGYRHGASVARTSGAREWITGPSSLHCLRAGATPPAGPAVMPPADPEKSPPELPPPRPMPGFTLPKQSAAPAQPAPEVESPKTEAELPEKEPAP